MFLFYPNCCGSQPISTYLCLYQFQKNINHVNLYLMFSSTNGKKKSRIAFINTFDADYRCWQLRHADGGTLECGHDKGEIRNSATKEELLPSPKSTLSLSTLQW